MSTVTAPTIELPARPGSVVRYFRETGLLVGRALRTIPAVPERLSDVTIQPIVFTLLFLYVFGAAIEIPGVPRYQDYLLPGLIGQSLAFGVIGAGVATANDFSSGVIDRFRSLPVTRLSVISAQVIGQVIEQILGMTIVAGLGLLLGWEPHMSAVEVLGLIALILLGLTAFTWFGVLLGMLVRSSDAMQGIGFAIVFPLAFLAGTFVPIEKMDLIPRTIGEWNPISTLVAAVRQITQGVHATGSWPLEHPVVAMVLWCLVIIGVCVPIALRRFQTTSAA
ncbi:ABC-2 type transporter [Patulibacter medicamentivorans]|jgi:ABC transporter DrrB family efflux protein|uniref:Transport permease protein n=1 Tax=Patulibacter medicamentivorans TaxID=1097667 RepID=H0EAT6_9ACTN|nr:ABC transporter permease [Patulibacter medicamentivorans]EHN09208.1 ABC-2 type transporter [Patulibacter medicamentivorans]